MSGAAQVAERGKIKHPAIYSRQFVRRCRYCKRELQAPTARSRTAATRDHIHPKAKGGRKTVPCCRQCNQLKGDWTLNEWQIVMQVYPQWWKRFDHRGELLAAIKTDAAKARAQKRAAEVKAMQRWAPEVHVTRSILCRGLSISHFTLGDTA